MSYRYDREERVEDSTKGGARVDPRNYKGDVYAQAWIDARKLAMLSIWLDDAGYSTRFLSEVLKFTIDVIVEHLVNTGAVEVIEFTEDARNVLEAKYKASLNPGGRGKKNLVHNLVLDGRKKRGVGKYNPKSRFRPQDRGQEESTEVSADISEAVRIYKGLESKGIEDRARKELEDVLANADIKEVNGERIITPKGTSSGVITEEDMADYRKREEGRKRLEEIERREKALEKRKEKKLDKIRKEKRDGREEDGRRVEGERTDHSGDSEGIG
jgi:hypothetical protein